MRFIWGVLCNRAIVDDKTKKLSTIDIPDVFTLPKHPMQVSGAKVAIFVKSVYVADFWFGENDDDPFLAVRLYWRSPDGTKVMLGHAEVDEKDRPINTKARVFLDIDQLGFRGFGLYSLELEQKVKDKWKMVATYPISIALGSTAAST